MIRSEISSCFPHCGFGSPLALFVVVLLFFVSADNCNAQKNLTFNDFKFEMKKGEKFDKEMITDDIRKYVGKKIKIRGYIRPSFQQKNLKQFILVRDNMEYCFGPGAMLYDCMIVRMKKGASTDFTVRPITVEGEFRIRIFNGPDEKPWAVYEVRGDSVK